MTILKIDSQEKKDVLKEYPFEDQFEEVTDLPPLKGEDVEWANSNYLDLNQKYLGEWIAINEKQVIAHGKDGLLVRKQAKRAMGTEKESFILYFMNSSQVLAVK